MKNLITILCFLFPLFVSAQVIVKDADLSGGQVHNWTKDNIYLLDGYVYLEEGGVLNIEAGTVIKGMATPTSGDNASALIIARGAKIYAMGTQTQPIIFTSEIDDTNDPTDLTIQDKGLWGGVVILGKGKIAFKGLSETGIEGIPAGEVRALYGGTDDEDNSGILSYVSIRHGGDEIAPGNELNGLTLGAVGSKTVLDHIEVIANSDDGIEFFGGACQLKYAAVSFCGDDSFDWDQGYRGKGQFWFAIQSNDDADNGAEMDGADPDAQEPHSAAVVYNATFIGSGKGSTGKNEHALLFRDGTGGTYSNSIFTDYVNYAIQVEDLPASKGLDSRTRLENGQLKITNNIFYDFGKGDKLEGGQMINVTPDAEDSQALWLTQYLQNNNNVTLSPELTKISRSSENSLDPRPNKTGAAYSQPKADVIDPSFFTKVGFIGAFSSEAIWLNDWTALDEYNVLAKDIPGVEAYAGLFNTKVGSFSGKIDIFPNPVSNVMNIDFEPLKTDHYIIELRDQLGKIVKHLSSEEYKGAVMHKLSIPVAGLASGNYFLTIKNSEAQIISNKVMITRS